MAFYRIKDAAEKIGVQPHVLRFWESQFPSMKPPKTTRGQRLYSDEDVENFLKIKVLLYNEGFSIPGAKKVLKEQKLLKNKALADAKQAESGTGEEAHHFEGLEGNFENDLAFVATGGETGSEPVIQRMPIQDSVQRSLQRAERAATATLERALLGDVLEDLKGLRAFARNV